LAFFSKNPSFRARRHANLACIHRKTIHLRARRSYSACRRRPEKCHRAVPTTAGHTARAQYPNSRHVARRSQISLRRCARRGASPTFAPRCTFFLVTGGSRLLSKRPASVLTLTTLHAPRSTHVSAVFIGKPYISRFTKRRRRPTVRQDRGVLADLPGGGHPTYPFRAVRAATGVKSAGTDVLSLLVSLLVAKNVPRR
jgi:hypothetical protein